MTGNIRRREDIRRYWFFDCECRRCADPSELGTNMSAIRCLSCPSGHLLPLRTLDYASDWGCGSCGCVVPHETVDEVLTTIETQV